MDFDIRIGIGSSINVQKEIAIKIAKICEADISCEHDLSLAIEKAIDMGIFARTPDVDTCPNCSAVMTEGYCPICNQEKDDPDLLDHDEDDEDREGDDLSDSEDADDDTDEDNEDTEKLFGYRQPQNLRDRFEGYLRDEGVSDEEISLYVFLVQEMLSSSINESYDMPTAALIAVTSNHFGKSEDQIKVLWKNKPFSMDNVWDLLQECFSEKSFDAGSKEPEETYLEIRKIGADYVPIVRDPYDDLVLTSADKGAWIKLGKANRSHSAKMVLKRKEEKNEILYKILETIIHCRKNFFNARSREEAFKILRNHPFEQQEVVRRYGLDKGTVSRHFSDKAVITHFGLIPLKDLSCPKALDQEDKTKSVIGDIVKSIIEQGDGEGNFLSDQKIADVIANDFEMKISREYVKYLREKLKIPSSRHRKQNASKDDQDR